MKYTPKQIKEFKKMGYDVAANGKVTTKTKLEKKLQIKSTNKELESLERNTLLKPLVKTNKYRDTVNYKTITRSRNNIRPARTRLTDEDRAKIGLVTTRNPNISYLLLPDDTKVCRSCQNRKPAKFFSLDRRLKDSLKDCCKDCEILKINSLKLEKLQSC